MPIQSKRIRTAWLDWLWYLPLGVYILGRRSLSNIGFSFSLLGRLYRSLGWGMFFWPVPGFVTASLVTGMLILPTWFLLCVPMLLWTEEHPWLLRRRRAVIACYFVAEGLVLACSLSAWLFWPLMADPDRNERVNLVWPIPDRLMLYWLGNPARPTFDIVWDHTVPIELTLAVIGAALLIYWARHD